MGKEKYTAFGAGKTLDVLLEVYRTKGEQKAQETIARMRDSGKNPNEMIEALLLHSLSEEHQGSTGALETRARANRKDTIAIWTAQARPVQSLAYSPARSVFILRWRKRRKKPLNERLHCMKCCDAASHGGATYHLEWYGGNPLHPSAEASAAGRHQISRMAAGHAAEVPGSATGASASTELYQGQLHDAVINKGEGIEHALRRQLENMPEKFGFHGDVRNHAAVHAWSGGEAHRVALHEDL